MSNDTSTEHPTCSLAELTEQFNRWRAEERTCRGTTPPELRRQAVALLDQHSRAQITRCLGVNANAFGQWWYEIVKTPGTSKHRPVPGWATS